MQEVSGSIPLFSTKKALYFVGSMVLFFLLKPVFGGCIASPAPFSGFCRRFRYNPQLLTLHRFQRRMLSARFFSRLLHHPPNVRRKVEIERNVELIPTINIYPADKLIDDHFLCFKTGTVVEIGKRNQFFVPLCRLSHNNASNKRPRNDAVLDFIILPFCDRLDIVTARHFLFCPVLHQN